MFKSLIWTAIKTFEIAILSVRLRICYFVRSMPEISRWLRLRVSLRKVLKLVMKFL